jgi:hypothetical protein
LAVFGCAGCGAVLTAAVSQVALPTHLSDAYWEALHPPLLEAGTYAVDPEPYGQRLRGASSLQSAPCPTVRRTPSCSHPATCAAPG